MDADSPEEQGTWRPSALVLWGLVPATYLCLALLQTAPLIRHFTTHIPLGNYPVSTTARFNLWTLWWNSDRLGHAYQGYWQAPIFHPDPHSFAYSETQWLTGAAAGVAYWLRASPTVAYNLILVLVLALNGWCGFYLLRRLELGFWPAFCGGMVFELLPIAADQLGVIQSTILFPVLMVLASIVEFGRTGRLWPGLACGVWMAACYHTSANTALLFGPLAVLGVLAIAGHALTRQQGILVVGGAALLAALLVYPIASVQIKVLERLETHRPEAWIRATSANVARYAEMPATNLLRRHPPDRFGYTLYPGTGILLLAGLGAWYGLTRRPFRRVTLYLFGAAAACLLLSFGPAIGDVESVGFVLAKPYELLRAVYPGFDHTRNLWRYGGLLQVFLAVLAGLGLGYAFGDRANRWRVVLTSVGFAAVLLELLCVPVPLFDVGTADRARLAWVRWLDGAPPATTILHLPMATGSEPERYEETTYWMNCQMGHGRPMANGYSGFVPEHTSWLSVETAGFPDPKSLVALRRARVTHVLASPRWISSQRAAALARFGSDVELALATPEMNIYRIRGGGVVPGAR